MALQEMHRIVLEILHTQRRAGERTESSCGVASVYVTSTMGGGLETVSAVDPEPSSVQGREKMQEDSSTVALQ
jgi:hypothetical protein